MKKSNKLIIAVAIFFALVIGFLIGISVEYPKLNNSEVSGTIGKVNNYRNTKATEADIQLKDELLADSVMLKSVKNYLNFFYVRSLEYGKNIDFAVSEANASEAFKSKNGQQITALDNYGKFLGTARKNLLLAVVACQSAEEADPVLLRNFIARANNIIAQINYRNSAVLDFITALDVFIQEKGTNSYPGLNKAHDLLTYNEIGSSIVLKDKVLLNFLDKKKLYSKDLKSSTSEGLKETAKQDMEVLGFMDSEHLGVVNDSEKLGIFDAEKLGYVADAEKLGIILDAGKLDAYYADIEKLGVIILDAEKLGVIYVHDSEKLGGVSEWINDTEKLGAGFTDSEKLGTGFTDSEKLGVVIWDVEKLGAVWDSEKLGSW